MSTRTGPLGKELTSQNATWDQRIVIFFSNKPIKLIEETNKIENNKIKNPPKNKMLGTSELENCIVLIA